MEKKLEQLRNNIMAWLLGVANDPKNPVHINDSGVRLLRNYVSKLWEGPCDCIPFDEWIVDNRSKYYDGVYDGLFVYDKGRAYRITISSGANVTCEQVKPSA